MVDPVTTSQVSTTLRTQNTSTVSKTSQRAAQALLDQLQQKPNAVSVSRTPLATTASSSQAPRNLPRGSLVDVLI
jgi:hypothetical protein